MKKLLLIGVACFALVGCQTAQDVATSITTSVQSAQTKAKSVQSYAGQICGYAPTVASVIGIFNSGFGTDVSLVSNAICNAVTSIPLADGPGDHKPRVNGVVIHGKFLKKR